MHPEGTFDAEVLDHGLDESKEGTPFAWAKFQTSEGKITGFFYLTDRASEHSLPKMDAMGWKGLQLEEFNAEPPSCAGNKCEIVVGIESYQGKERAKVQFVNPLGGGGGGIALNKSARAAANVARFNGLLEKVRRDSGTQAAPTAGAAAPNDDDPYDQDSDVPF